MTPYEVLGVPVQATRDEIRRAYLLLARRHHPDQHATGSSRDRELAEQRMREVNEAWAVLGDPRRRRELDTTREKVPRGFVPFSPADDDPDPLEIPDLPYRPQGSRTAPERSLTMAPAALFLAAAGVGGFGAVIGALPLVALGGSLFALSCLGFLVAPIVALARARQDEG